MQLKWMHQMYEKSCLEHRSFGQTFCVKRALQFLFLTFSKRNTTKYKTYMLNVNISKLVANNKTLPNVYKTTQSSAQCNDTETLSIQFRNHKQQSVYLSLQMVWFERRDLSWWKSTDWSSLTFSTDKSLSVFFYPTSLLGLCSMRHCLITEKHCGNSLLLSSNSAPVLLIL